MHTDKAGHRMFGWEYVLVFAFEFTLIVTIVNKTLLKLRFVKLIFEDICFYRNAAILNAVLNIASLFSRWFIQDIVLTTHVKRYAHKEKNDFGWF